VCPDEPGYGDLHLTPKDSETITDCRRLHPGKKGAPRECLMSDSKLRDAHEQGIYGVTVYGVTAMRARALDMFGKSLTNLLHRA
jgi:hypothetical protein